MSLGHEKLDVYRLSLGYIAWVYEKAGHLNGIHRAAREQWLRASPSIPLNIAEGNGKTADADRRRYFEIARGLALPLPNKSPFSESLAGQMQGAISQEGVRSFQETATPQMAGQRLARREPLGRAMTALRRLERRATLPLRTAPCPATPQWL